MKNLKETIIEQIAPQLRALRIESKLSLIEIACKTDLSINTIDDIELGKGVSFNKYKKLIRCYGKKMEVKLK